MSDCLKNNTIENSNLSLAWAEAFLKVYESRNGEVIPLVVSITDLNNGEPQEVKEIRESLDSLHKELETGMSSCETASNYIFPWSLWFPERGKDTLFKRYMQIEHKLRKNRHNCHGIYFLRFIDYQNGHNQLAHIINTWNKDIHRRSAFVLSVFDPLKDHVASKQRGFPCLQQVSFVPDGKKKTLAVNAFYANQDIFPHAYGNYLGLCRLGLFVAYEMKLRLERITCFSGIMNRRGYSKKTFANMEKLSRAIIARQTGKDQDIDE